MLRMVDIARELDVSRSLVSKVLSGRMGSSTVRPELARAIRAKAKAGNYRPNASATALIRGRQNVVGVFICRYGQPGSGLVEAVMEGLAGELARNQQRLLLQFFRDAMEFESCLAAAHRNVLDGVVLAGFPRFDLERPLRLLLDRQVPVVTMISKAPLPEIPNAGIDQTEVGRLATRHLIEQGCRRVLCLRVAPGSLRFAGYRQALRECGLPFCPELVCETRNYAVAAVPQVINALLSNGVPFDGVVASSDQQASVVLRMLLAAGRRVPQDVKLIGVDDSPFCQYGVVPLSSVSGQDRKRAGLAVRLLQEVIDGRPARHLILPPVVAARGSSAMDVLGATGYGRTNGKGQP